MTYEQHRGGEALAPQIFPFDPSLFGQMLEHNALLASHADSTIQTLLEDALQRDKEMERALGFLVQGWAMPENAYPFFLEGFAVVKQAINVQARERGIELPRIKSNTSIVYMDQLAGFKGSAEEWLKGIKEQYDTDDTLEEIISHFTDDQTDYDTDEEYTSDDKKFIFELGAYMAYDLISYQLVNHDWEIVFAAPGEAA